jgi:hypothetical protein
MPRRSVSLKDYAAIIIAFASLLISVIGAYYSHFYTKSELLFYARNIDIDEWDVVPDEKGPLNLSIGFDLLFANNSTHNVILSDFAFTFFNIDDQYPKNSMSDYISTVCHDNKLLPSIAFTIPLNEAAQLIESKNVIVVETHLHKPSFNSAVGHSFTGRFGTCFVFTFLGPTGRERIARPVGPLILLRREADGLHLDQYDSGTRRVDLFSVSITELYQGEQPDQDHH